MSSLLTENKTSSLQVGHPIPTISIMVVDDDNDDALLIKEAISDISPKYQVIPINKSELVLQTLDTFNYTELPSLLILDYNMPIISGLQLLQLLKANHRYTHIPVVVYSNSVYPKHKEACLQAGACVYLPKSATVKNLHEDIKQLLSHCL